MQKAYTVVGKGFVGEDGKPAKVGDTVRCNPRNGNTTCGIRFKQIKPAEKVPEKPAEKVPEKPAEKVPEKPAEKTK